MKEFRVCLKCKGKKHKSNFIPIMGIVNPFMKGKEKRYPFCQDCQRKFKSSNPTDLSLYSRRNFDLRSLGFSSYQDYLSSPLWKTIREKVFKRRGRNCRICGAAATQVHHNRYDQGQLTGKTLNGMFPVCGDCHRKIEFDGGRKLGVNAVAAKYRNLSFGKRKYLS